MFNEEELQEYFQVGLLSIKGMVKAMSSDDELLTDIAILTKKMHNAYFKAGFTEDQAFALVSKINFLNGSSTGNKS